MNPSRSGTVSLLFTDIDGSTRLLEETITNVVGVRCTGEACRRGHRYVHWSQARTARGLEQSRTMVRL